MRPTTSLEIWGKNLLETASTPELNLRGFAEVSIFEESNGSICSELFVVQMENEATTPDQRLKATKEVFTSHRFFFKETTDRRALNRR